MTPERDRMASRLDEMGNEVTQKNSILKEKNRQLLEQDKALHTAYYRIGPYKTLRDLEILEKVGGFLGINQVTALTDDPDAGLFTEIDTRQLTRIPIVAKRWKIVVRNEGYGDLTASR
jgi:hypothetical protein